MSKVKSIIPVLAGVALIAVAGWGLAGETAPTHMEVDQAIPCDVCHTEVTPEVVSQWYAGAHGRNTVRCFVCHGSTGDDFRRTPDSFGCVGCHGDRVETMAEPVMKGKTCFTCHSPHRLDPHKTLPKAAQGGSK